MRGVVAAVLLAALLQPAAGSHAQTDAVAADSMPAGDRERGRLVFAPCRSCHFTEAEAGHGNGPNLHRIFGKVAGSQPGFDHYSAALQAARFVWTPALLYAWLEAPMLSLPGTTMMSAGVPDPGRRADLIAYLEWVSVRSAGD
jgi:cytochrome c